MSKWNVYRDNLNVIHLPGANPGTPYTLCMLDAGSMKKYYHDPNFAGFWCTECLKVKLGL